MIQDENGIYHWIYELDMNNNRSILNLVLKLIMGIMGIICVIVLIVSIKNGVPLENVLEGAKILLLCLFVIFLICLFAYWLVKKMYDGTYVMIYDMDEEGISFSQTADQAEKTRLIAGFASMAGAASKNYGLMASGAAAAYNTSAYSKFTKVTKVIIDKDKNLINLCSPFLLNMVYVEDKDFEFVENYICQRCTKAIIKRKS